MNDRSSPAALSASEASRKMEEGFLSAEELARSCLERIDAVEPTVQA